MTEPSKPRGRNSTRVLFAVYVLTGGKAGVGVQQPVLLDYIVQHRLLQMTDSEFNEFRQQEMLKMLKVSSPGGQA
jgi:hypothetical protein